MRPADKLRAPPQNKPAPTPSTRLLPRYQREFFELGHLQPPTPKTLVPPDCPRLVNPGSSGLLVLARPSAREDGTSGPRTSPKVSQKSKRRYRGNPTETPG